MLKIPRIPVDSSQVESVGHDEATKQLDVAFKSFRKPKEGEEPPTPSVYRYSNVTPDQFADLMASESKGRWINQNLKALPGSHPFRKLTAEEAAQ
jgi:hypothetical protein